MRLVPGGLVLARLPPAAAAAARRPSAVIVLRLGPGALATAPRSGAEGRSPTLAPRLATTLPLGPRCRLPFTLLPLEAGPVSARVAGDASWPAEVTSVERPPRRGSPSGLPVGLSIVLARKLGPLAVLLVPSGLPWGRPPALSHPATPEASPPAVGRIWAALDRHPFRASHIGRLVALFTDDDIKLDSFSFTNASNNFKGVVFCYCGLMNEDVFFRVISVYESISILHVKPFHRSQNSFREHFLFLS